MSTLGNKLPFGQRIGVFILAEISAISASSVIILLGYIAVRFLDMTSVSLPLMRFLFSIAQLPFAEARSADGD
jgi:hypothetical protein